MFKSVLHTFFSVTLILVLIVPMGKLKYFFAPSQIALKKGEQKGKALQVQASTERTPDEESRRRAWMVTVPSTERVQVEYIFYCSQSTPEIAVPPPRA